MTNSADRKFMARAIELAQQGVDNDAGGPFGCVIVKGEEIVGEGWNQVTSSNDPTAHAEIVAIRHACRTLNKFELDGCAIYASCEPCPMCLGAIYWARLSAIFIAGTRHDAAAAGFDDEHFYGELAKPDEQRRVKTVPLMRREAKRVFASWNEKADKISY